MVLYVVDYKGFGMEQIDLAIKYAESGLRVFPCNAKNKAPLTANGFKDATLDIKQIKTWWKRNPDALIGHPNDELVVVDIDDYGLDEVCSTLMMKIKSSLTEPVLSKGMCVSTMSGGKHYYFKKGSTETKRKIKNIAQVDILGSGGYVILPDQTRYVAHGSDRPWELFGELTEFNNDAFDSCALAVEDYSSAIKAIIKEKKATASTKKKKEIKQAESDRKHDTVIPSSDAFNADGSFSDAIMQEIEKCRDASGTRNRGCISIIDPDGNVLWEIPKGIYSRTEDEFASVDPTIDILEDGPLRFSEKSMDTTQVMILFHNIHVQRRLCEFMGLPVPSWTQGCLAHSIIPEHEDARKSMGTRWNQESTHILVRDFANFYQDKHNQIDYNLVRLYACLKYKTNVPRLNGPEWVMWFMRMLVEANVITIDNLKRDFNKTLDTLTPKQKQVAESLLLLDAIKRTYKEYEGQFPFAVIFGSAWAGTSTMTVSRTLPILLERGFLNYEGMFDCSGGRRSDTFMHTKLYTIVEKGSKRKSILTPEEQEKKKTKELTTRTENSSTEENVNMNLKEAINVIDTPKADKKEKELDSRYPDVGTYVGIVVDEKYQTKIKNFLEDIGLSGTEAHKDYMGVSMFISDRFETIEYDQSATYFMDQFSIDIVEPTDPSAPEIMVAYGLCPPLREMREKLNEKHDGLYKQLDEEDRTEQLMLVISSDASELSDEWDTDELTLMFNEYVEGKVSLSSINLRYMPEPDILNALDGKAHYEED